MDLFQGFGYDEYKLFVQLYGKENTIIMLMNFAKECFKCKL